MSSQTFWERARGGSKAGFDKLWKVADKVGAPVNRLSNKLGSEAFWPTTMDKESDKAARILQSFCKDGFYAEQEIQPQEGPKLKQRVVQKIPEKVIKRARGLAIFTTMRTGLWISGAGGSGVLIARQADDTWSPPSGILLHTAGLGFLAGVDIYDCVLVLNTDEAVQAFTKIRCTLGSEISVVAGPVGAGGILETELHKRQAPIYTYMKSRGFYAGVQIDGTVIIERSDENERFYNHRLSAREIISGKVRHPPYELKMLMETLKAAQGDTQFDADALPSEPPPGDYMIDDGHTFGVPDKEDPDPYGVLALEKEGLSLKEAGTQKRASWEEFSFQPAPTSPIHSIYARKGSDDRTHASGITRASWRASAFASHEPKSPSSLRNSMDTASSSRAKLVEMSTQTDDTLLQDASHLNQQRVGSESNILTEQELEAPMTSTATTREPANIIGEHGITTPPHTPVIEHAKDSHLNDENVDDSLVDDFEAEIGEPVVHSVQKTTSAAQMVVNKARIVSVPKRGPPPVLPPRNPTRRGPIVVDAAPRPERPLDPSNAESTMGEVTDEASPSTNVAGHGDHAHVSEMVTTPDIEATNKEMQTIELVDVEGGETQEQLARVSEEQRRENLDAPPKIPGGFD